MDFSFFLSIKAIKPKHIEVFGWNMYYKTLDKIVGRDSFVNKRIVFVTFVVEGDVFAVIAIDSGLCDNGATKIAPNVIDEVANFALSLWGMNIKTILSGFIAFSNNFFESGAKFFQHEFEKNGLERLA